MARYRSRYSRDEHSGSSTRGLKKALPWALGTAAALWLFWPRNANAATPNTTNTVARTAKVQSGQGGMIIRDKPAVAPTGIQVGDAKDGTTVQVLQTGITPVDASGGEWWKITNASGVTGYSRAVDPQGNHNFDVLT
jgi:hypothetical protein